jgi:hypothetical protein
LWQRHAVVSLAAWLPCSKRCGHRLGRAAAAAILSACLLAPVFADENEIPDDDELVVPPGQDELLADMLGRGAPLPGPCRFAGGAADGPVIESTYQCPTGEVVLELVHSSQASPTAIQTERFAITVQSGSLPDGLVDAVASLLHAREGDFEWKRRVGEASGAGDERYEQGE